MKRRAARKRPAGVAREPHPIDLTRTEAARFWQRVEKGTGCWIWTGTRFGNGYGAFPISLDGERVALLAHRVAYVLEHGADIPGKHNVINACGTKSCVRPDHHVTGTISRRVQMTRERGTMPRGEQHHAARFTSRQIVEMRRLSSAGWSHARLATKFDTTPASISAIVRGDRWKDDAYGRHEFHDRVRAAARARFKAKLRGPQVLEVRRRLLDGEAPDAIAHDFGVRAEVIRRIGRRETWRTDVPGPEPQGPRPAFVAGKLDRDKVRRMRALSAAGHTHGQLGKMFGVSATNAARVVRGDTWRDPAYGHHDFMFRRAKLDWPRVRKLRTLATKGWTLSRLAARFELSREQTRQIVKGERWKDPDYGRKKPHFPSERKTGEHHPHAKLTWGAVRKIRRQLRSGAATMAALAREFGVWPNAIKRVVTGEGWTETRR